MGKSLVINGADFSKVACAKIEFVKEFILNTFKPGTIAENGSTLVNTARACSIDNNIPSGKLRYKISDGYIAAFESRSSTTDNYPSSSESGWRSGSGDYTAKGSNKLIGVIVAKSQDNSNPDNASTISVKEATDAIKIFV